MWLPHGLSRDSSLQALKATMQLCNMRNGLAALPDDLSASASASSSGGGISSTACVPQDFQISRPAPALLLMRVPALQPRQRYLLRVKADPQVCMCVCV
jgi:hypothetical protein